MDLVLRAVPRPAIRDVWFPLDHPYVERCWPSVVGPTSVLLLRRAAAILRESSEVRVVVEDLGRDLGIGTAGGGSRLRRTIQRLHRIGLVRLDPCGRLDVFVEVPPLKREQLSRASQSLRDDHTALLCARARDLRGECANDCRPRDHRSYQG